jgi:subtilisin-like proprotein convertase family protein
MRRHPLTWFFVLLLCAAGVWLLLRQNHNSHISKVKVTPSAAEQFTSAWKSLPHRVASQNAIKAAVAAAQTNHFAWRLSNTSKPLKQLVHDPHAILLENAFIDTSAKTINLPIPNNLRSQGDPGAYVVQANGTISPAFRAMLAQAGATMVSYIPNNAYLVRATETVANDLAANPQVQAVVPYEPYYKVQAPLLALADQPLPANVQLNLALFPEDAATTLQQIEQLGGILISEQNSLAGYPIVKVEPPPNWTAVAQLPGVHIVEPSFRRGLANDLARPALGVAADPFTPTNYLNLQGLNVTVQINDSGIDTNHPDLQGRVFFNDPAEGFDTDGHGTHIAGIIAGSGLESPTVTNASIDTANLTSLIPGYFGISGTNGQFRGKAPLANMFAMNFQDDDLTLQETAATNNALISNNSWNFAGDFDYDLEAASYDAATRDALPFTTGAQPVLFVFSSGNDGGGNAFNVDGNNPDSIDSPATAKDVMTVGALEEDRMITNIVTNADGTVSAIWQGQTDDASGVPGFSSSGNVGIGTEGTFGRYKPDVVAPGTFVISCRSSEWNTNTYFNPTNDNFDVFPDFIEGDSVSVAPFDFFVPSNAVEVIFTMVTNLESPRELTNSMPVYISNGTPVPSPFTLVGAGPNPVVVSPAAALDQDWSVEVSNVTTVPIAYDLIVDVLTTNNAGDYFQVLFGMDDMLGTQPEFYRYETGTSMSAAAISGFLADIEDYFTNQLGLMPSPALLKAMTINGSRAIGTYKFQVQNTINEAGWGQPDLSNSVPTALTNIPVAGQINTLGPACSTFFRDQNVSNALATGDSETFNVTVITNDDAQFQPLRFTVAWTDPPGDPSAGVKLVNSLELVVTDLDNPGIIYYGNDIGPDQTFNTAEGTNTPPVVDNINNIQNIFIFPPLDSHYSVTVIGSSVNVNAVTEQTNNDVQDFAMVISSGDMGEITDALMVADGGIVSNPTRDQNISFAVTNTVLLNQTAGANTPLLGTNTIPLTMMGTNSQFTIGMTNEWHFYLVTNLTTFTNAVFITFNAETLATPRMGVLADSIANSTVPGPDLDMLVTRTSTDGNAAELTNLWPSVVSNCLYSTSGDGSSLVSGGTDFVAYTNAVPNEVFYVGVKSENHMAVQYDFVPIFTQTPFGGQDTNGNQYLNGLNVPQPIAEGTPSAPSKTFVFMLDLDPVQIQNVVVTNTILAQNFGSLVGSLKHNGKTVVLNNHDSFGGQAGTFKLIYDDSGQNDIPGSRPSDGPGSLRNYDGADGTGIWQLTEEGTTLAQTGVVENSQIFLQKHQDPQNGINVVLQPGEWFYDFVVVPPGITNLEIFGTNVTAALAPQSIQMFLLEGAPPTANDFDFEVPLNQGIPPGNEISDGPPLAPDVYWIGLFNPNLSGAAQDVFLLAVLNGISTVAQPTLFTDTNATPIVIDAVTNTTIVVSNANTISSVNVGMVVQYPRMSDLAFTLISPTGQRILLMENRGGPTATNAGDVFFITNSIGFVTANGSFQPNTNYIPVGTASGSVTINYNMFTLPDDMTVYDGTNGPFTAGNVLFDTGLISGSGSITVAYSGTVPAITIIMNQFGNPATNGADAWTYNLNGIEPDYNFLTFTEDTNLTDIPIKFATPPFDLRDLGTNFTFGNLDFATNGDYFGQTNINDAFGGWFVPSNLVVQVTNGVVFTNNYNEVSVVSDPAIAFGSNTNSSNYLALGYGVIQRTNNATPFRLDTFSYEYRGPGIAGWWRGEGDARDSSDAEQRGQNGSLIGRFDFPAGEVSQAFAMENNGGEFDFAGTNGYVQIRQQPFLVQASTNASGNPENGSGTVTVQTSSLDVGTGPGLTVEGWINPTNVSFQQPLVEWLTRVPTNGSDTNLFIRAGPFLDRATEHYYYMLGTTDWLTSEQWAEDLGGHLATVDTADEQNWIFDTFAGYAGKSRNLWIGLTNLSGVSGTATNFVYSSGATNLYFNWLSTQPNDTCRDANYTFMFGNTNTYRGLWTLASDFGVTCDDPTNTNVVYGVVEVTNQMTNGVQFWISITTAPGATNIIMTNTGCLFANVVDSTNGSHWIYSAPGLVQSNLFQHVALTYNTNSGIANLYYNGTNVASTNWGGIHFIPKTTGDVLLGKDMNLESSNFYGGLMDEMSIYGRALSDAEIQAIYSVSAFTTNRLIGKFDPTVTPPESLAKAQVVLGNHTNMILGANNTWQQGSFTFTTQTNALFMQISGIQPGILLDDFSLSQAPLGNLYYQPEQSLDELKGESAQGNWTLEIWDTRLNAPATNAQVINWQLQMILQTNNLLPVPFGSEQPGNITVNPGQITTLAVTVPSWVTVTTNRLISSTLPLNVFVNTNAPPTASVPPDYFLYPSSGPNNSGSAVLDAATTPPTPPIAPAVPPAFIPGQTYYIGLQNPGTSAASVVFEVDFNVIALTNNLPFQGTLATNTSLNYFSFDVTTNNPYEATFQLLNQSGNADLVVSKGGPLPTLTSSDYGSFNSGRADENIYVLTNSSPVPLSPGTWYLGVFNRDSGAVNYTVLAKELDLPLPTPTLQTSNMTLVQLTNGVPLDFTSGPGAALTNFFYFIVTNNVAPGMTNVGSIRFELYNETGNGGLTVQTNIPPFAPPFFQSSDEPGTLPNFIQVQTNSALTNLNATWYLGVPNNTTNVINYTIVAVIDTNNVFPAFPGAQGAGAGALGASIRNGFSTNNTVYHVFKTTDDGSFGTLRDAVSSTNRTIIFDISGVIALQSPLTITNSYLTIEGQTAPPGGITVAGAPFTVQNAHDVILRDLRLRSSYSSSILPAQTLYESEQFSGAINEYSSAGVATTFVASTHPLGEQIAFNSSGDLFVGNNSGSSITEITPGGTASNFGSGFSGPGGVAVDSAGNVFVADGAANVIYKLNANGTSQSVFATTGLNQPHFLTFDGAGNLFVSDFGSGNIYEFSPTGTRTTYASGFTNPTGLAFNSAGDLFVADLSNGGTVTEITPSGRSVVITLPNPQCLAFDNTGDLFVAVNSTSGGPAPYLEEISSTGVASVFSTQVSSPIGVAFGPVPAQTLFSSESGSPNSIDEFTPAGGPSTFTATGLNVPYGIAFDSAGNLYVANCLNDAGSGGYITEITPGGVQSTFASQADPKGMAFDKAGNLYVTDYHTGNIYKYTPAGVQSLFAMVPNGCQALAFDSAGNLYVNTTYGGGTETIVKITPGGVQSTFASGLSYIGGLAFDSAGNLYESDNGVGNIYKFTPAGVQSTFATLSNIGGLAFDTAGNLFVAAGSAIDKFTPAGVPSTFASGLSGPVGLAFAPVATSAAQSGGGAYSLQLNTVSNVIGDHLSITWSTNDNLYIANSTNTTVQWSIISDSIHGANGFGSGTILDTNNGGISLNHNLYADNAYANPQLNGNVTLDFVDNVIYDWGTNAGISANDSPDTFTNYLNYACNYVIASTNSLTNYIAFWGGTTNTWIYQTNNFIDSDTNGILNGANTQWNMFTNQFTETNQFPLPQPSVDEAYLAYEKVLDFAGVDLFKRDFIDSNIVENVRQQDGSIISSPGGLPTLSSTLIYLDSVNDGVPDFWKITFGQAITNKENNSVVDASGYSELEEFDNWLAIPHALTYTNQPVGVNLQKLFGRTGNLSFFLTNADHGTVYLTNVLGSFTNTSTFSNSIAIFTPTNEPPFTTNYSGFGSFGVVVTNNDTLAYFGPVPVSVFISAVPPSFSEMGTLTNGTTNVISANSIVWYLINVPTNAVEATNSLLYAGAPMNLWYSTNVPPTTINPGDFELLSGSTNGLAVINVAGAPLPPVLKPGGTYYLGVQNTNSFPTNYAVSVTFDTPFPPIIIIIITPGQPITNVIPAAASSSGAISPAGSAEGSSEDSSNPTYIGVLVPPNAVSATNTLLFATGGTASLWFNQNNPPLAGFPGDFELIANYNGTTPINVVLTTNSTPSIIPGQVYYLAITNTSSITLTDAFEVNFGLFYTPPFLPAQSNLTIDAGATLVVDNTATDTNAGTLFYTLTTAPPVGATISGSGVITWNVPANQPAGNVLFTTVVSNSFTTLTATNSFTVTVLPLAQGGAPVTNTVPAGSIDWLAIDVPPDAIWATNILIYATNLPVNVLFTTNFPPSTNGAFALMSDVTNGISILGTNTAPTNIVQGGVYYIGIQNTNSVTIGFAFEVNFDELFALGAPFATTLPATHVTGTAAQLNGLATPNASPAFAWFDFGTSTNYELPPTPQQPVVGSNLVQVTSQASGLLVGHVYHYRLVVSNAVGVAFGGDQLFGVSGIAVWGNNISGVTNVPVGLTNTTAIAAEAADGVALSASGKVTVWGDDTLGQTAVPAKLTNVVAIAAGDGSFALALQNGTVTGWGDNSSGQTAIPSGLSNVVAIAAGTSHSLALEANGTVIAWGANGYGQTSVPAGLSNVVAIAAGVDHSVALLNNGTVVAWGAGETNTGIFPDYGQSIVPPGLTNVIAISAYGLFSSALEANGTVVAWGENNFGQTQVPGGLNGVVAISDGLYHMLSMQDNGLAAGWGNNVYGESTILPGLTNIFAIAGGNNFSMALESPLSINLTVTPLNNGSPQTNSIAANSVAYYSVTVPANAVAATNLLSFATAPLNLWFNQTNLPVPANPPDKELLGSAGSGASATLFTNGVPPLVPGQTYFLAIQNTNNMTVNYVFGVNFETVGTLPGTNLVFFTDIIKTNIGGTNGFLIRWLAPTNDTFRVQQTPSLTPPITWNSFSNIVAYAGPPVTGNGLFTFFDNGSQYPFVSPDRFYRVLLFSQGTNLVATPLSNGSPQTNTIPANSVVYYSVPVPTNAIAATNLFSQTAGPLNLWFNQNTLPFPANPPDTQLLGAAGSGAAATLVTNGAPPLVPGQTYYLAIQNTNSVSVNYVFGVNFETAATGSGGNLVFFTGIIQTNIGSTNGFLIRWLAPTNDTFQVQEIPTLTPPQSWNSFSNVVTYAGPPVAGNGLFTFFDNGAEYSLGQERFYRIVLMSGGSSGSLVIASQPNYVASVSQPFSMTNSATDSNLSAILDYTLANFPAPSTSPVENNASGVITWTPGAGDRGAAYKFTTVVSDNSLPVRNATNAFTVFVLPAPSLGHAAITATNVTLTWTAPTNDLFQVDWATSLAPPVVWSPFPPVVFSTNGTFTLADTNAPNANNRFYRLVWLPLP